MVVINVDVPERIAEKLSSKKHREVNLYVTKLIKEDMLLSEINDSKKSGINKLSSIDELDS